MASDLGVTVEQFFTDYYGGKPEWLNKIDYGEKRKTNPDFITRLRPIEEVLPDYLRGNELSEAEYESIWTYDKMHPNLLSGMKQIRAADISMPIDMRRQLGETAFAALSAADSRKVTPEESYALILSIGQDMDYIFGRYDTLEEYYDANPERAAELQAFTIEAKARDEEAAVQAKIKRIEEQKAITQAALVTLSDYASGAELNDGQKDFIGYMKSAPISEADYDDPAYIQAEESLMNLSYEDLTARDKTYQQYTDATVSLEFKRAALDALDADVRIAKTAGMTLSEMYEMFPNMRKTPEEMMDYAKKYVEQKWAIDDPQSVYGWLFGVDDLKGEGVGALVALGKGGESGVRKFAQGFMGFWRNYFTETENKDEVVAQNRSRFKYSGPMGRTKANKDFDAAISAITNPEHQAYWQNYKANVKDILNLPFDFADEAVLNTLYENQKAIDLIREYMVENASVGEFAAFSIADSLVDTGLSMGTAFAATALTGNPTVGTTIAFFPRAAYDGSEIARAAGLPQWARNPIGLIAGGITVATEKWALTDLQNSAAYMRGSMNLMKTAAMNGGAGYLKKLGTKIAFGTATIGLKLAENVVEQGSQEFVESVLTDIWLNIVGAQNKGFGAIIEEGAKEAVMAAILSPILSGQAYLMTSKGKVTITKDMQQWAKAWMDKRTSESLQNPETVAKIIEANAAANTIDRLVNGELDNVDTSVVNKTKEALKTAGAAVTKANNEFTAVRIRFVEEMQKYVEKFEVISEAEYEILLRDLETGKKTYHAAKKAFALLSGKLKQAQGGLDRLIAGIITSARAEDKVKAQADILSEVAARRMEANMQKASGITEATVRFDQPAPENVSIGGTTAGNDSIPLAPSDGSGIINEGTQTQVGGGAGDEGGADAQATSTYDTFKLTPELENHIMYMDESVPRNRGIGGAHNSEEFFKNDVSIATSIPSADIPGVTWYKYSMPLLGKDGKPIGGYGKTFFKKTVYDPKIFPHDEYMKRGLEAANDALRKNNGVLKRYWEGYDSYGVKWVGFVENGLTKSFYPDIPV